LQVLNYLVALHIPDHVPMLMLKGQLKLLSEPKPRQNGNLAGGDVALKN